jgi:2-dehydro-3-deoxygluconokinase
MEAVEHGHVLCFGEMLLRLTAPAGTPLALAAAMSVDVGGAEANVAASLAQLGHQVRMVSSLPDGPLGDMAAMALRRHGVDTDAMIRGAGRMGLYFLEPGAGPRPSRIVYDRAGSLFASTANSFDWPALLRGASWLHLSGITAALGDHGAAGVEAAVEAARAARVPVSFDCNYRPSLWKGREAEAPKLLSALIAHADVMIGSYRDMGLLTGREVSPDANAGRAPAAAAFDVFPQLQAFVSTHRSIGPDGEHCLSARLDRRSSSAEAAPVTIAGTVDRIGSGDAFVAAVIDGLLIGRPDEESLKRGLAAAALKHTMAGDQWIGNADDLDSFEALQGQDVQR